MRGMHRPHVRPTRRVPMQPIIRPHRGWRPFIPGMACLPGLLFSMFMFGLALFWLLVAMIL